MSKKYIDHYVFKGNSYQQRATIALNYDFMINPDKRIHAVQKKYGGNGYRRIGGYDQANGVDLENLRIDPTTFDKITERENKSFIILKNQIDNYTFNYDDYFGMGSLLKRYFVRK